MNSSLMVNAAGQVPPAPSSDEVGRQEDAGRDASLTGDEHMIRERACFPRVGQISRLCRGSGTQACTSCLWV